MSFELLEKAKNLYYSLIDNNDAPKSTNECRQSREKIENKQKVTTIKFSQNGNNVKTNSKKIPTSIMQKNAKTELIADSLLINDANIKENNVSQKSVHFGNDNQNEKGSKLSVGKMTKEKLRQKQKEIKNLIAEQPPKFKRALEKNFNIDDYCLLKQASYEDQYMFLLVVERIITHLQQAVINKNIDEDQFITLFVSVMREIFDSLSSLTNESNVTEQDKLDCDNIKKNLLDEMLTSVLKRHNGKCSKGKNLTKIIKEINSDKAEILNGLEVRERTLLERFHGNERMCQRIKEHFNTLRNNILEACQLTATAEATTQEEQLAAQYYRNGAQQAEAEQLTIDLQKTPEGKAAIADAYTQEFHTDKSKRYYEQGDAISANVFKEMVAYSMQYKTAEAAAQYEEDAYEYRQKIENGEINAPWMSEEHLEALSTGIKSGIANNKTITADEKSNILSKLDKHSNEFEYPSSSKLNISKGNHSENNAIKTISTNQCLNTQISQENEQERIYEKKATSVQIEQTLSISSLKALKELYPQTTNLEIADVVLHTPKLKSHLNEVTSFVKTLPIDELFNLTYNCPTETYCYLLRNLTPEKAGKLYDLSSKNLCYTARTLGENIIEETNEAA